MSQPLEFKGLKESSLKSPNMSEVPGNKGTCWPPPTRLSTLQWMVEQSTNCYWLQALHVIRIVDYRIEQNPVADIY